MMDYINCVGMKYNIHPWDVYKFGNLNLGDICTLKREPENKFDENTIAVYSKDKKIGYIPRQETKQVDINYKYLINCLNINCLHLRRVVEDEFIINLNPSSKKYVITIYDSFITLNSYQIKIKKLEKFIKILDSKYTCDFTNGNKEQLNKSLELFKKRNKSKWLK
ncbi:MAG: HIRAN domain-containing protein [Promethearchaeota archaeon]